MPAFINGLVWVANSGYNVIEAVNRFNHTKKADPVWMFWLGMF
jgi:Co/Zn/Cd efflux system component